MHEEDNSSLPSYLSTYTQASTPTLTHLHPHLLPLDAPSRSHKYMVEFDLSPGQIAKIRPQTLAEVTDNEADEAVGDDWSPKKVRKGLSSFLHAPLIVFADAVLADPRI